KQLPIHFRHTAPHLAPNVELFRATAGDVVDDVLRRVVAVAEDVEVTVDGRIELRVRRDRTQRAIETRQVEDVIVGNGPFSGEQTIGLKLPATREIPVEAGGGAFRRDGAEVPPDAQFVDEVIG